MAVSKARRLPTTPRTLWETVVELQREFKEFRAQRTLESSSIGAGGLTVQDPARPERIVLSPKGLRTVPIDYMPPAVEFYSGAAGEVAPGQAMGYTATGGTGPIPAIAIVTGDLGAGFAYLEIQSGNLTGDTPALNVSIGDMGMFMSNETFFLVLGLVSVSVNSTGIFFTNESWNTLPLSAGWTATGGTWQVPMYYKQADNTVQLVGSMSPGTLTSGTVIGTLSPGYIPPGDLEYRLSGGSSTAGCDLVIHGTGAASPGTITITNVAGTVTRISLSSIRFSL